MRKKLLWLVASTALVISVLTLWGQSKILSQPGILPHLSRDTLPIHGRLSHAQIDRYYPHLLDTMQTVVQVGAEPVDLKPRGGHWVSLLHNTGTFDQIILCTHDSNLILVDHCYIGKATNFDQTSHTIEFNRLGANRMAFHHVDWGWVENEGESDIDTIAYRSYVLKILDSGKIERE